MNLVKERWTKEDVNEFQEYLRIHLNTNKAKVEWSKNLLNTSLPVLVMKTPDMKEIVNQIAQGNYLSFLDLMIWEYYENTAINGMLISKIKDYDVIKKYLDIYSEKADNWATCDLLSFNIKKQESKFFDLVLEYIKSDKPFKRRIGIVVLFNFVNYDEYIDKIFEILNKFEGETEYYVNMINAWLLCECFIKHRDKTIEFLNKNKLNKFVVNKAISKCRDSRRVSVADKEMLIKYRRK
ncbi:MAG: DNA alkylation repair protein [Clostridia bacterium]|nr:DNA alkylation repair protein [Clostridia bacterium]